MFESLLKKCTRVRVQDLLPGDLIASSDHRTYALLVIGVIPPDWSTLDTDVIDELHLVQVVVMQLRKDGRMTTSSMHFDKEATGEFTLLCRIPLKRKVEDDCCSSRRETDR